VYVITSKFAAAVEVTEKSTSVAVPTAALTLAEPKVVTEFEIAAFAGTTDKSPNPSEATATADTFFNEIVFTIFLSFSQIKVVLLSGW
jgi:hypothetical protein